MKKTLQFIVTTVIALSFTNTFAQNVGINSTGATPNTSAMLDVSATNKGVLIPNVSLTSLTDAVTITTPANSLVVYNTNTALTGGAGYYYNSGSSAAPVWVNMLTSASLLGQSTTDYYSTGSLTVGVSTAFAVIPGCTATITVPANTSILVTGTVGIQTTSTATGGFSSVDVVIALDGSLLANGGYERITAANNTGLISQMRYGSFDVSFPSLSAGTHTIAFYAGGAGATGSANATVAGNSSSVLQSTLTVTMIKK